jgi:hypothetical protein
MGTSEAGLHGVGGHRGRRGHGRGLRRFHRCRHRMIGNRRVDRDILRAVGDQDWQSSTPSSTASTSMVALSVSISASTSPDLTLSPVFLSQRASLPCPSWWGTGRASIHLQHPFSIRLHSEHDIGPSIRIPDPVPDRWCANSALSSATIALHFMASITFRLGLRRTVCHRSRRACARCSMGSDALRACAALLRFVRYFAGSDMEWPR